MTTINEYELASKFLVQLVKDFGILNAIVLLTIIFFIFNGKWIVDKITSLVKDNKIKKLMEEENQAKKDLIAQNKDFIESISNITELFNEFIANYDVILSYNNYNVLKDYLLGYRPNFIVEVTSKLYKHFDEEKIDMFALNHSIKQLFIDIIYSNLGKFIHESFLESIKEKCLLELEVFLKDVTKDNFKDKFNDLLKTIDKILVENYNNKIISDYSNSHIKKIR